MEVIVQWNFTFANIDLINWTYTVTPERVVYSADVNPQQWQGDSEKIVRQKAVVVCLGSAAEDMIEWR